jgi:hypothetical protein
VFSLVNECVVDRLVLRNLASSHCECLESAWSLLGVAWSLDLESAWSSLGVRLDRVTTASNRTGVVVKFIGKRRGR